MASVSLLQMANPKPEPPNLLVGDASTYGRHSFCRIELILILESSILSRLIELQTCAISIIACRRKCGQDYHSTDYAEHAHIESSQAFWESEWQS